MDSGRDTDGLDATSCGGSVQPLLSLIAYHQVKDLQPCAGRTHFGLSLTNCKAPGSAETIVPVRDLAEAGLRGREFAAASVPKPRAWQENRIEMLINTPSGQNNEIIEKLLSNCPHHATLEPISKLIFGRARPLPSLRLPRLRLGGGLALPVLKLVLVSPVPPAVRLTARPAGRERFLPTRGATPARLNEEAVSEPSLWETQCR